MDSEDAECRHLGDYCQTRTSCMICFIEKERNREQARSERILGKEKGYDRT